MPLRYEDEHYVRVYTRDVNDWLALSFDAQSLLMHLFRKVDRAGVLELGRHGKRGVAIAIHHRDLWERLEPALDELLADGVVTIVGERLIVPNFIEAQTATKSDKQRQREHRERARDSALGGETDASTRVTERPLESRPVTNRDGGSRIVTNSHADEATGHDGSQPVTSGHSVLFSELFSEHLPSLVASLPPAGAGGIATQVQATDPNPDSSEKAPPKRRRKAPAFDPRLLAVYALYPRRDGRGKTKGLLRLQKQITTVGQYERLLAAVKNYAAQMLGKQDEFIKQFSTWADADVWVDDVPTTPPANDPMQRFLDRQRAAEAALVSSGNNDQETP